MSLVAAELFPSHSRLSARLVSALGGAHSSMRATIEGSGPAVTVCAGGEVDASNDSNWRALLHEAAAMVVTSPGVFVVDVNGLDFIGCCAYAALSEEAQRCRHRGIELRLVSRQPIVPRIVAACQFNDLLPVYPSLDCALPIPAGESFGY